MLPGFGGTSIILLLCFFGTCSLGIWLAPESKNLVPIFQRVASQVMEILRSFLRDSNSSPSWPSSGTISSPVPRISLPWLMLANGYLVQPWTALVKVSTKHNHGVYYLTVFDLYSCVWLSIWRTSQHQQRFYEVLHGFNVSFQLYFYTAEPFN